MPTGKELAVIPADTDQLEFDEDMALAQISRNRVFRRAIERVAENPDDKVVAKVMDLGAFDELMPAMLAGYADAVAGLANARSELVDIGKGLAAWRLELDNHRLEPAT